MYNRNVHEYDFNSQLVTIAGDLVRGIYELRSELPGLVNLPTIKRLTRLTEHWSAVIEELVERAQDVQSEQDIQEEI